MTPPKGPHQDLLPLDRKAVLKEIHFAGLVMVPPARLEGLADAICKRFGAGTRSETTPPERLYFATDPSYPTPPNVMVAAIKEWLAVWDTDDTTSAWDSMDHFRHGQRLDAALARLREVVGGPAPSEEQRFVQSCLCGGTSWCPIHDTPPPVEYTSTAKPGDPMTYVSTAPDEQQADRGDTERMHAWEATAGGVGPSRKEVAPATHLQDARPQEAVPGVPVAPPPAAAVPSGPPTRAAIAVLEPHFDAEPFVCDDCPGDHEEPCWHEALQLVAERFYALGAADQRATDAEAAESNARRSSSVEAPMNKCGNCGEPLVELAAGPMIRLAYACGPTHAVMANEYLRGALLGGEAPKALPDLRRIQEVLAESSWEAQPKMHTDDDGVVAPRPTWTELFESQRRALVIEAERPAQAVLALLTDNSSVISGTARDNKEEPV